MRIHPIKIEDLQLLFAIQDKLVKVPLLWMIRLLLGVYLISEG